MFVPHQDSNFDVTLDIAVRIDDVENIVNGEDQLLSIEEKRRTATVGCEIGNLTMGRQKRWTISTSEDVNKFIAEVGTMITSVVLPYVEKFSNLESLLTVLSSDGREAWLHFPVHLGRCQRILSLTLVLGKDEELDTIIAKCEFILANLDPHSVSQFESFAYAIQKKATIN